MSEAEKRTESQVSVENEPGDHQPKSESGKVIEMDNYRSKHSRLGTTAPAKSTDANGLWEWTTQPLLPPEPEKAGGSSPVEAPQPLVRIVKVSSGFGRLHVPAWNDSIQCRAA